MVYDLQKASITKRIAAWMLDLILVAILTVGVAFVLSSLMGYDKHSNAVTAAYDRYEQEYGVSFSTTQEEYMGWSEDRQARFDEAYEALISDEEAMHAYNMVVNLSMVIASLSLLISVMGLEFVVPVLFREGRTVGKRVFNLCVIRNDCVRAGTMQHFVRALFGKYVIGAMIPVYLVMMVFWGIMDISGTFFLMVLLLIQIIVPIASRKKAALHDLMAGTVVADYSSQMIFDSTQALVDYQKKIHAERAARQEY